MLAKDEDQGAHTLSTRVGGAPTPSGRTPLSHGPPAAPPTSTPTPYIPSHGEKKQRGSFIAFYDTEPLPSPKTSREG